MYCYCLNGWDISVILFEIFKLIPIDQPKIAEKQALKDFNTIQ